MSLPTKDNGKSLDYWAVMTWIILLMNGTRSKQEMDAQHTTSTMARANPLGSQKKMKMPPALSRDDTVPSTKQICWAQRFSLLIL
eukprot:scaffold36305_cov35-Cyclotella_meneghiniana.AAC.4